MVFLATRNRGSSQSDAELTQKPNLFRFPNLASESRDCDWHQGDPTNAVAELSPGVVSPTLYRAGAEDRARVACAGSGGNGIRDASDCDRAHGVRGPDMPWVVCKL